MKKYTGQLTAVMFSAATMFAAACGDKADTTPRQVELTPPPAPVAQPPISDAPVTPPPAKTAPPRVRPTPIPPRVTPPVAPPVVPPAAAKPTVGMIPVGAEFAVRPSAKICTNTQKVGDHFTATVSESVAGSEGTSIPAGATATLEVTESQYGKNDANKVRLNFKVVSVAFGGHTYDVVGADIVAPPITKDRRQSNTDQAGKIAAGVAVGAVVGKVLGKSTKATVGGAAVGGLAGAAAAAGTADYDGCVAAESRLAVKLSQGLQVRIGA